MTDTRISEARFVDIYGDVEVGKEPAVMPLNQALKLEALLCPAEEAQRRDPDQRLRYLARMVGNNLLEEHRYLLTEE